MSENADAGSQKKSDFTKENSTFTEDNGTAQEERQSGDDYRRRDTYHQAEKGGITAGGNSVSIRTGNGRKPLILNRISIQKTMPLQREKNGVSGQQKLDKLQKKAEKAGRKTEAARRKLPKKTEYSLERVFDEKTGRAKYVLTAVKRKSPLNRTAR